MEIRYVDYTSWLVGFNGDILLFEPVSFLQFDYEEMEDSLEKSRAKSALEALQVAFWNLFMILLAACRLTGTNLPIIFHV